MKDKNLIPDEIIETFYKRVKLAIDESGDKNHPAVQRELNRIKSINNKIPLRIVELLK